MIAPRNASVLGRTRTRNLAARIGLHYPLCYEGMCLREESDLFLALFRGALSPLSYGGNRKSRHENPLLRDGFRGGYLKFLRFIVCIE